MRKLLLIFAILVLVSCADRYETDPRDGFVTINLDKCDESSLVRIIRKSSSRGVRSYRLRGKYKSYIGKCFQTSDVERLDMRELRCLPVQSSELLPTIGDFFFSMNKESFSRLESVYLPSSARMLGDGAFIRNKSLKEVYGDSIRVCGMSAFEGCTSLETVRLPLVERMGVQTFQDCVSLKDVDVSGLKTLENSVFQGCDALERLSLPSVIRLEMMGVFLCPSLSLLELPSAVEFCNGAIIASCKENAEIVISSPGSISVKGAFVNMETGTINLVLNDNKRPGGTDAFPVVEPDGKTWNGDTWRSVRYVRLRDRHEY